MRNCSAMSLKTRFIEKNLRVIC